MNIKQYMKCHENVDHVEVMFIITQKSMKNVVKLLRQIYCFLFSLYHIVSFIVIITCCLYYKTFSGAHSAVFIHNLVDIRYFTVYIVYCSIYIK